MAMTGHNQEVWRNCDTVQRLLKKNELPSEEERSVLLKEISAATTALDATNASTRDRDVSQRERIQSYIDTCNSLLSPMRGLLGLPTELLVEVFVCGLAIYDFYLDQAWSYPLLIAQICRHWRAVATSAPALWSHLVLSHPSESSESVEPPHPELVRLFLSRSAEHPLTLHLGPAFRKQYLELYNEDFLQANAARCKSLKLFLSPDSTDGGTDTLFQAAELPQLVSLEIEHVGSPSGWQKDTSPGDTVTQLPCLRSFTSNGGLVDQFYRLDVPWSQLTSLTISLRSEKCLRRFPSLIAECHELAELTVDVELFPGTSGAESEWSEAHPVTHLPTLKMLRIKSTPDVRLMVPLFVQGFVNALTAPQLKALFAEYPPVVPLNLWTKMLVRSQCAVQWVEIPCATRLDLFQGNVANDLSDRLTDELVDDLVTLLQSMPSVQVLYINVSDLTFRPRALHLLHYLLNGTPSLIDPLFSIPDLEAVTFHFAFRTEAHCKDFISKLQRPEDPRSVKSVLSIGSQSVLVRRLPRD